MVRSSQRNMAGLMWRTRVETSRLKLTTQVSACLYEVSATSPGFNPHGGGFTEGFLDEDFDPIVFERITSCYWTDGMGKMGMQEVRRARA